jgi:hypothetical protein
MCLNQIFKDEQLAIIRYTLAPSGHDVTSSLQALRQLRTEFREFPYPHRPYVPFRLLASTMGGNAPSLPIQGND